MSRNSSAPPRPALARAVGGADAGGDEDRGADRAGGDVRYVPGAGRIDRIVAGGEGDGLGAAVVMLLVEDEAAGGADHQLGAMRMHLPGIPAFGEAILRDEPPLDPVRFVARGVGGVPFHVGEFRFYGGGGAEAEMGWGGGEVGHLAVLAAE